MAKSLKLKLSRVIPSLQLCRSKHPSTFAKTTVPAIYRISPFNPKAVDITYPNLPAPPPSTPEYSFSKSNLSPKVVSVGCGCRSGSRTSDCSIKSSDYTWKKEAAAASWRVDSKQHETKAYSHRKTYDVSSDGVVSPVSVNENKKNKQRNKKNKNTEASFSSCDSGFFSSEEDEYRETDTLLSSSRSFSNEYSSSNFDPSMEFYTSETKQVTKKKVNADVKQIRRLRRYASKNHKGSNTMVVQSPEIESPVRASVLKRMIACTAEGKVRESVAVVKKSVDPYEDFKRSMLEMILEKEMFDVNDLQELLQCFLSLNTRHYHGIIVEAFAEIWEVLFCDCPVEGQRARAS